MADTFILVFEPKKAHMMALEFSSGLQVLRKTEQLKLMSYGPLFRHQRRRPAASEWIRRVSKQFRDREAVISQITS